MITIELSPTIFQTAPWDKLTKAQQASFFYVIDDSASVHTQAKWFPRPTQGGMVNSLPKVSGQGPSRVLAIGLQGERVDETILRDVFTNKDGSGGTAVNNIADGIARGILIVKKDGVVLTYKALLEGSY